MLVEPYSDASIRQAIEAVLGDESLAQRMKDAGLDHARSCSWDASAVMLAEAYRKHFHLV